MYENANSRLTYNDDLSHADGSGQKFLFLFDSAGKKLLISCLFNLTTTFVVIEYNDDLCCFQAVCSRRRSA